MREALCGLLGCGGDGSGDDLPRLPPSSGPEATRLLLEGTRRVGVATYWRAGAPPGATKHDLRAMVGMAVGRHPEVNSSSFDSLDLVAVCDALGIGVEDGESTRSMKRRIGGECGFDYESPDGRIRDFYEDELVDVATAVVRAQHRGGRL